MVTQSKANDPTLKQLRDYFNPFYSLWQKNKDSLPDPSQGGVPNLTKLDVDNTIISLYTFLNSNEAAILFNPIGANPYIRGNTWQSQTSQLTTLVTQLFSSKNANHWPSLIDHLHGFQSTLNIVFNFGPNFTSDKDLNNKINTKIALFETHLTTLEKLTAAGEMTNQKLASIQTESQNELEGIKLLGTKINEDLAKLKLIEKGINQQGLASSFRLRADKLDKSMKNWLRIIAVSIIVICSITLVPTLYDVYHPYFHKNHSSEVSVSNEAVGASEKFEVSNFVVKKDELSSSQKTEKHTGKEILLNTLIQVLIRILISSPIIWVVWFAAKQFSQLKILKEEYEYKTATAEAFYGYNQQASTDEELKKQLLEGVIKNFNENPTKEMDPNQRVSPIEEAVFELFKHADISKIEQLKNLVKDLIPQRMK